MIRGLVGDLLKYLPAQVVPAIVGVVSIPVFTRIFSPSDYGAYSLVVATVTIMSIVANWLGMSVIRFYPVQEQKGQLEQLYSTVLLWLSITTLGLAAIFAGGVLLARTKLENQLYNLMLAGVPLLMVTAMFTVLQQFLRARRWVGWYSAFSVWDSVARFGLGLALALGLGLGVSGLVWGAALGLLLALPFLWQFAIRGRIRLSRASSALARTMARYSLPLVAGNLAVWVLSLSDRYLLEIFRGTQEVGIYSASYGISEKSILLLGTLFMFAAGPLSIQVWETKGEREASGFLTSVTRLYLLLGVPAVVGLAVLARPIVELLTGPEYREGYRILPFVALGVFFLGLQQRFQAGFIFRKRTQFIMTSFLGAGAVNVLLNVLFIPKYGYMAAAVTTLVSYALLLAGMVVMSRKLFVWAFPFKSLGRVVLASMIMAAIIYPLGNSLTSSPLLNLLAAVPLGALLYFSLLFLFGEIQSDERRALKEFLAGYLPGRFTPASWKKMP